MATTTTTTTTTTTRTSLTAVVASQLDALDDTDCYATAWQRALQKAGVVGVGAGNETASSSHKVAWGGRGQGGRGMARRTFQPHDIVVEDVRLEYAGNVGQGSCRVLLEKATLKLLSGQVFCLMGVNASGKSTLLRRIDAGRIPGFPPHVTTLYIPQEVHSLTITTAHATNTTNSTTESDDDVNSSSNLLTPMDLLRCYSKKSAASIQEEMTRLEMQMDALDMTQADDETQLQMEAWATQLSELEDEMVRVDEAFAKDAAEALAFVGLSDESIWNAPIETLSPGLRKRLLLAIPLMCRTDLLLLDEPTNGLDITGLLMLRQLIDVIQQERGTTILMVSHDVDLMDDVADQMIDFFEQDLLYYPGNYSNYRIYRQQNDIHQIRQVLALEKKRNAMLQTLDNLKKQPVPKRGGAKKKGKQIESHKKKLEKQGLEKDDKGHRRTNQTAGTGIKVGSINAMDASTRRGCTTQQLLEMAKKSIAPPPDKAIQFNFKNVSSQWGEPLIMALDVGHGYPISTDTEPTSGLTVVNQGADDDDYENNLNAATALFPITKKPGFLFDCVDLCINEGECYCILGESASGKSTLLRLLAKLEKPLEGTVKHAWNVEVSLLDQHTIDTLIEQACHRGNDNSTDKPLPPHNAISYLAELYPKLNEQVIRGILSSYGLNPQQATTNVKFLSGGERCRLCLAAAMLREPQVLLLDDPTAHLDVESVQALVYGLSHWNGTVVMVSHDTHFVRSLSRAQSTNGSNMKQHKTVHCYALVAHEGKLRRVEGGMDAYLRSFA